MLNVCDISWLSNKQQSVASSTIEAEYIALATISREAIWYLNAYTQLGYTMPITIMADNTSSINIAEHPINNPRTSDIDVAYHCTREYLICKSFTLSCVPYNDNTANLITKGLKCVAHHGNTQRLGLSEWERVSRHTFCHLCWVITIALISLISLFFPYSVTPFLISCRHPSIVFYLFLV